MARILPPAGLIGRWTFYSSRYGFIHAACRYLFSRFPAGWRYVGPLVTAPYRRRWLATSARRIINLGGGGNALEGCLTVDIDPRADCYADLTNRLPFDDDSIDAIFCEEAIEHIPKAAGTSLLLECMRVMRPGAIMRITTPDLDYLASTLGEEGGNDEINRMFYEHGHRYIYSRSALKRACVNAGFEQVWHSFSQDRASQLGYLDTHVQRYGYKPEMAQFVEMIKPLRT